MSSSPKTSSPIAKRVSVSADFLEVALDDGRELRVPLAWFPRLFEASAEQRNHWRLIGGGRGIHWPDLDEDLSVQALLSA